MTRQSGSTLRQTFTASATTASNRSSGASMVIFCAKKLTVAEVTPSSAAIARSIFAAQAAQSAGGTLKKGSKPIPFFEGMAEEE